VDVHDLFRSRGVEAPNFLADGRSERLAVVLVEDWRSACSAECSIRSTYVCGGLADAPLLVYGFRLLCGRANGGGNRRGNFARDGLVRAKSFRADGAVQGLQVREEPLGDALLAYCNGVSMRKRDW
jgi:hypothetical protein